MQSTPPRQVVVTTLSKGFAWFRLVAWIPTMDRAVAQVLVHFPFPGATGCTPDSREGPLTFSDLKFVCCVVLLVQPYRTFTVPVKLTDSLALSTTSPLPHIGWLARSVSRARSRPPVTVWQTY